MASKKPAGDPEDVAPKQTPATDDASPAGDAPTPEPPAIIVTEDLVDEPKVEKEVHVQAHSNPKVGIVCPLCGSTACGIAGGQRHCNQCSHSW